MSNFQYLLNIIASLNSGKEFNITVNWCKSQGLTVDTSLIKTWMKDFAKVYSTVGCSRQTVSPKQGTANIKAVITGLAM